MDVRDHLTEHEQAERHPLITDAATVTLIENMDRNRTSEVQARAIDLLEEHGKTEWLDRVVEHRGVEGVEPDVDWERLQELVETESADAELAERIRTLKGRFERPYPSLFRVRFAPDTPIDFSPGQYVTVRYQDVPRPYSVASSPLEDEIEIAVRRVPGGRLTSELAVDLSVGDEAVLRGPYGHLLLEEPSQRDLVFLATGTGVAPIRSMIEYTVAEGRDVVDGETRDVWLFLGTGWEDDLAYRERFRELDRTRANFHFVPTLSRENVLTDWQGETAYGQYAFCKYLDDAVLEGSAFPDRLATYVRRDPTGDVDARIDPEAIEVYTVGIGAMVRRLVDVVDSVGVDEAHVHAESYG